LMRVPAGDVLMRVMSMAPIRDLIGAGVLAGSCRRSDKRCYGLPHLLPHAALTRSFIQVLIPTSVVSFYTAVVLFPP